MTPKPKGGLAPNGMTWAQVRQLEPEKRAALYKSWGLREISDEEHATWLAQQGVVPKEKP
jgi:hypothetical protein